MGHLHLDHAGGLEKFAGTDIPIYAHELEIEHLLVIVRSCERFEEGKFYFKAALEHVLEIETQDVKNAFQIIDNYWPPIGQADSTDQTN